jgi:hypothetical protein
MKSLDFSRYALCSCVAAALLAACGGSQPLIGVQGAMTQGSAIATHADRGKSWMLPEAKGEDLLYTSGGDQGKPQVAVFSYPQGKFVGRLTLGYGGVHGLCSDGLGDVFIPEDVSKYGSNPIYEYAHGGTKPIAMLADSDLPYGCAVDPTTGNLAVTNQEDSGSQPPGNVAIYSDAQGTPTYYTDSEIAFYAYCAYDNAGNLFVTGWDSYDADLTGELPEGSGSFENITINEDIYPGSLQWHDGYLLVGELSGGGFQGTQNIYQVQLSGASGTVTGKTVLQITNYDKPNRVLSGSQFWVQGSTIIGSNFRHANTQPSFWRYPKGGLPKKILKAPQFGGSQGVTLSFAK